jgi:putative chitinase
MLQAAGVSEQRAAQNAPLLQAAADEFGIDTPLELAHWLAQICHESGCLRYVHELWGPTPAQRRYDTRSDLGNTPDADGDGYHNRGVGFLQYTGEYNIERALQRLGYPPDSNENLATPDGAARSAALFWFDHGLDTVAIRAGKDVKPITRIINGGYNGLAERQQYFDRIMTYMAATMLGDQGNDQQQKPP